MIVTKIIPGAVIQRFDTLLNRYTSQEFVKTGAIEVQYSTGMSDTLYENTIDLFDTLTPDMVQPDISKLPKCAVCGEQSITIRSISINNHPKQSLPLCEIHADAAEEDRNFVLNNH